MSLLRLPIDRLSLLMLYVLLPQKLQQRMIVLSLLGLLSLPLLCTFEQSSQLQILLDIVFGRSDHQILIMIFTHLTIKGVSSFACTSVLDFMVLSDVSGVDSVVLSVICVESDGFAFFSDGGGAVVSDWFFCERLFFLLF